jgi:hypothetical protein
MCGGETVAQLVLRVWAKCLAFRPSIAAMPAVGIAQPHCRVVLQSQKRTGAGILRHRGWVFAFLADYHNAGLPPRLYEGRPARERRGAGG